MLHSTVVERSYERYRIFSNPGVDYLHHPSGVTVVVLAEKLPCAVTSVTFGSKHGLDRHEQSKSHGGKKGALRLQSETRLCLLHLADGSERCIRAGVRGFLAEVNNQLRENPDLVRTAPENHGYLAIITYAPGQRRPVEFKEDAGGMRIKPPALF